LHARGQERKAAGGEPGEGARCSWPSQADYRVERREKGSIKEFGVADEDEHGQYGKVSAKGVWNSSFFGEVHRHVAP